MPRRGPATTTTRCRPGAPPASWLCSKTPSMALACRNPRCDRFQAAHSVRAANADCDNVRAARYVRIRLIVAVSVSLFCSHSTSSVARPGERRGVLGDPRRPVDTSRPAHGLRSRRPRPGGLYDGDDEASRVPGKPTRTHATRSDPGEVAAATASEQRRCGLPSNARRRPSQPMHFGAQSRSLRAPCERFAPWVTPGPRITRFRLAADLGRMGLDTHRVSNKVSKITSRHLVPLDRAFPAHALVHGSRALGAPRSTSWPS